MKTLSSLSANFKNAVQEILDHIADKFRKLAIATTLFKGSENSGVRKATRIIRNGSFARTVLADKDYAGYLEYGNNQKGAYIYPVRAKCLHFFIGNKEIFCAKAKTHGPLPFFGNARNQLIPLIPEIINQDLEKWLK